MDEDFSFLQPLDIITKDVNQLRQMIKEKRKNIQKDRNKDKDKDKEVKREHEGERGPVREKERHEKEKEREKERERERAESNKEREKQPEELAYRDMVLEQEDKDVVRHEENGTFVGPEAMDIATTSNPASQDACEIPSSEVTILEGHTSEVCACAWSPTGLLLASGTGDSTARIWTISDGLFKSGAQNSPSNVLVLKHVKGRTNEKSKDVTTLDWNISSGSHLCGHSGVDGAKGEGTLLATGSYDGQARIWTTNGELRTTLSKHKGPIFSLKWNKKGDYLLTGSCDKTAIVWDVKAEEWRLLYSLNGHRDPVYSVAFNPNGEYLASGSLDKSMHIWSLKEGKIVKTYTGNGGIFEVCWNKEGDKIAACFANNTLCVLDFRM